MAGFLALCLAADPAGMVTKQALFEAYSAYATERGDQPISKEAFGKGVKASSLNYKEVQRKVGGKTQRVLLGVRLNTSSQD